MTETSTERETRHEVLLDALREEYPGADFHDLRDGWLVLPKGTKYVYARDLTGLPNRLAAAGWPQ